VRFSAPHANAQGLDQTFARFKTRDSFQETKDRYISIDQHFIGELMIPKDKGKARNVYISFHLFT
jgi:hypothetical protein